MFYIAFKNEDGTYYIEQMVLDWHDTVDGFEPIDCIDGEILIFDEDGNKYHIGPSMPLVRSKFLGIFPIVDVGAWDFSKGEPFLVSLGQRNKSELDALLESYDELK